MHLSTHQKQQLSTDLANIEYDEVYDELYDHYATLVENGLIAGRSFEVARAQAWQDLGAERGVKKIERDFVQSIRQQIRNQHWLILKSYFRWPLFVTTALMGVLVYLVVPMLSGGSISGLICIGFIPALFLLNGYWHGYHNHKDSQKLVWEYVVTVGFLPVNLFQLGLSLLRISIEDPHWTRNFLQAHTSIAAMISFSCILYAVSFAELYRQKYHHKPAFNS